MFDRFEDVIEDMLYRRKNKLNNDYVDLLTPFNDMLSILDNVLEDVKNLKLLDIDKLNKELHLFNETDVKIMKMYQMLSDSLYFSLDDNDKQFVFEKMKEAKKTILFMIKSIEKNNMRDNLDSNIVILEEILTKIKENKGFLSFQDINKLSDIMSEDIENNNLDANIASSILTYLTKISLERESIFITTPIKSINSSLIKENNPILDVLIVADTFSKYGYVFDDFGKEKEFILKYGNITQINNILSLLNKNKIDVNIFKYAKQFSNVLVFTDISNMKIIMNNIYYELKHNKKDEYNNMDMSMLFNLILKVPSIFISGTKHIENNKTFKVSGSFNNYIANRSILLEEKMDVISVFSTLPAFFTYSNNVVKDNILRFKLYAIPKNVYLNTLSSFKSSNPLDTIDMFIELNCFEYLLHNFSQVNKGRDNELFYKIKYARLQGKDDNYIFKKYKNSTTKIALSSNITSLSLIDRINGPKKVGEYFPNFQLNYDMIIDKVSNCGPIIKAPFNKYIIILDQYKMDNYRYNFNGIIISRYKVLRIFETLIKNRLDDNIESIKYAVFKNSILTKEEYEMLNNILDVILTEEKEYHR